MLMLTHVVEGNKTLTIRFPAGQSPRIGRDPVANDVILHDPGISRTHAVIDHTNNGYMIRDLGSKKGTLVNGGPVSVGTRVSTGDVIEIGPFVLLVDAGTSGVDDSHESEKTFRLELKRCPNERCNAYVLDEFETCMTCGAPLRAG